MTEEEKYYTPSIEEFHVGFEYEIYSEGLFEDSIEDFCGWYSYKFQQGNCFRDFEDIKLNLQQIRVKYLDKSDIESLGWKEAEETKEILQRFGRYTVFECANIFLTVYSDNMISIVVNTGKVKLTPNEPMDLACIFNGTIKNKNELKTLMKQLGINI